ncbi:MAG: hypothetical protein HW407_1642, partial [Bacteroidetes bacterium]|nr:hypothetical protein [Bacteroidota bacterium]
MKVFISLMVVGVCLVPGCATVP